MNISNLIYPRDFGNYLILSNVFRISINSIFSPHLMMKLENRLDF